MQSSEPLVRQPRSAIRYRPRRSDVLSPPAFQLSRQLKRRHLRHDISITELSSTQIMPAWCFVVLGMLISFILLYVCSVVR